MRDCVIIITSTISVRLIMVTRAKLSTTELLNNSISYVNEAIMRILIVTVIATKYPNMYYAFFIIKDISS